MFRPLRPIRPLSAVRPLGAPLVRGLVAGGAAYAAHRRPAGGGGLRRDLTRDLATDLAELGRMVQQGLLTPEEFATAKARLLTG